MTRQRPSQMRVWWRANITATTAPPEPRPKPPSSLTEATTATRRGFRADEFSSPSRLTRHDHRARSAAGLSGGRKPCRRADGIVGRDRGNTAPHLSHSCGNLSAPEASAPTYPSEVETLFQLSNGGTDPHIAKS